MEKMTQSFKKFAADESGATAIEYGLLASLIAVVIIGPVRLIGTSLQTMFNAIDAAI